MAAFWNIDLSCAEFFFSVGWFKALSAASYSRISFLEFFLRTACADSYKSIRSHCCLILVVYLDSDPTSTCSQFEILYLSILQCSSFHQALKRSALMSKAKWIDPNCHMLVLNWFGLLSLHFLSECEFKPHTPLTYIRITFVDIIWTRGRCFMSLWQDCFWRKCDNSELRNSHEIWVLLSERRVTETWPSKRGQTDMKKRWTNITGWRLPRKNRMKQSHVQEFLTLFVLHFFYKNSFFPAKNWCFYFSHD